MLARSFTTILPAMTFAEAIDTTRTHRVAGLNGGRTALVTSRPYHALTASHLGCRADRRQPDPHARRGVAGAPRGTLPG